MKELLTFKELIAQLNISEELHHELQSILDEPTHDSNSKFATNKFNKFSKKVRDLSKSGQDTGLQDGKPKKGSSRAVFFPRDPKSITIDGVKTQQPTAVKIAIHGNLDKHTGHHMLLGELQNEAEGDHYLHQQHGILHEVSPGVYKHNPNGVLIPKLGEHPENHWLESAKAEKLSGSKFTALTKTASHPKGLKFNEFKQALVDSHREAHGQPTSGQDLEHVRSHPLYQHVEDYMHESGMHPDDLDASNMGVYKHPVTGKEQVGITDAGFTNEIAKLYSKARRNKYRDV